MGYVSWDIDHNYDSLEGCNYRSEKNGVEGVMEARVDCLCGKCGVTLADGKAKLQFQCGCQDCRQALNYGYKHGGVKPDPLPKAYYMPSDVLEVRGQEYMKACRLRGDDPDVLGMSTRVYCRECYSIIGVDHPIYEDAVFLNFPKHCNNKGDLSAPLTAYVMMIDYTEDIGPLPTEDVPLFTTGRFQQELDRIFSIPAVAKTFVRSEVPPKGKLFSSLIEELGEVEILGLAKGAKP